MDNTKNQHRKLRLIEHANGKSLEEINGTVEVPHGKGFFRTLFAYSGPGALVAVGYMDPGNWSTSITGGQSFQYTLMTTILISSLIARPYREGPWGDFVVNDRVSHHGD